jgi:hypothetical protein
MPSSMESHAAAMLAFTNPPLTLVPNALKEPVGTETPAELNLPEPVLQASSSTKIQTNVSLQPLHVEISPTSTELAACAFQATT